MTCLAEVTASSHSSHHLSAWPQADPSMRRRQLRHKQGNFLSTVASSMLARWCSPCPHISITRVSYCLLTCKNSESAILCVKKSANSLGEFLLPLQFRGMLLLLMWMHLFSTLKEMMGNKTRRLDITLHVICTRGVQNDYFFLWGWRYLCHRKGRCKWMAITMNVSVQRSDREMLMF